MHWWSMFPRLLTVAFAKVKSEVWESWMTWKTRKGVAVLSVAVIGMVGLRLAGQTSNRHTPPVTSIASADIDTLG